MSRPTPPSCTLSASGATMVWESASHIGVVDLTARHLADAASWESTAVVAISSSGGTIALATDESVTLHSRSNAWAADRTYPIEKAPFRLAIGDDGLVVAAAVDEGEPCDLVLIDDAGREVISLGTATPFTVGLDAERERVLVAGLVGPGSFRGDGDPFVGLYSRDILRSGWTTEWSGPSPITPPNGWVFPLAFGDVGVHSLDHFAVLSPESNPDDIGIVVDEYDWPHLETMVASPSGTWVSWFWSNESAHIRSVRLADGHLVDQDVTDGFGRFASIAVSDDGTLTIADTTGPNEIRVRWMTGDHLETAIHTVAGRHMD